MDSQNTDQRADQYSRDPTAHNQQLDSLSNTDSFDGSEEEALAQLGGVGPTGTGCEAKVPLEEKTTTEVPFEGKTNVVRCQQCKEALPIRAAAPPEKLYVRCPCNALLICKATSTSTRVVCPRLDCRRVITLAAGASALNAAVPLEGKTTMVMCQQCNEATPLGAAPPGQLYIRCPCNCLLVCEATSTRVVCPRLDCRRVLTLAAAGGPANSKISAPATRAPVGTCNRAQCAHCQGIFTFNTLTCQLAACPYCQKISSVGARHARLRLALFMLALLIDLTFLIGLIAKFAHGQANNNIFMLILLVDLICTCIFLTFRVVFYWRLRISQILGPL